MTDEPGEGDGTRIDIPLGFDVPDGWTPMDPATAGSPGVVFLAVRSAAAGSVFTPNITIVLDRRPEGVDLTEVADDSVERLSAVMDRLAVLDRKAVGDRTTPGITQVIRMRTTPGESDQSIELVQTQVHLAIPLGDTPADRIVVELACTATPEQAPEAVPDFQRLVASFHIRGRESPAHSQS